MRRLARELGPPLAGVAGLLIVWAVAAAFTDDDVLPSPATVWQAFTAGMADGTIPEAALKTPTSRAAPPLKSGATRAWMSSITPERLTPPTITKSAAKKRRSVQSTRAKTLCGLRRDQQMSAEPPASATSGRLRGKTRNPVSTSPSTIVHLRMRRALTRGGASVSPWIRCPARSRR